MTEKAVMLHGNQGGGWVPDGKVIASFDKSCSICLDPMVVGQRHYHITCCAAAGGISNHPACNPKIFVGGDKHKIEGCAHCGPKA